MCGLRILILCVATALLGLGGGAAVAADGPIGTVERVAPAAFGTPPSAPRGALGPGDVVVTDEVLETSASGTLHLRLIDESELWLDHDSLIVLDELVFDRATTTGAYVAELGHGLFRFVTGALPHASYEMRTPVVVVGVRGTDFAVFVASDGATRVTVYSGVLTLPTPAIGRAGGDSRAALYRHHRESQRPDPVLAIRLASLPRRG